MRFKNKGFVSILLALTFVCNVAFPVGKVLPPPTNQTAVPIAGRASNGDAVPFSVDSNGNITTVVSSSSNPITASSAILKNVAATATTVTLLDPNPLRKEAMFFNDSTQTLYLKFGTTASVTSYTVQIPSGGYYELPPPAVYTGRIDAIWAAANGAVRITELQ